MHNLGGVEIVGKHIARDIDRAKTAASTFIDQFITAIDSTTNQVIVHTCIPIQEAMFSMHTDIWRRNELGPYILLYYIISQPLSCLSFPLHCTFAAFCFVLPIEVYFFTRYKD